MTDPDRQPHPHQLILDLIDILFKDECSLSDDQCWHLSEKGHVGRLQECDDCPLPAHMRNHAAYLRATTHITIHAPAPDVKARIVEIMTVAAHCKDRTYGEVADEVITFLSHPHTSAAAAEKMMDALDRQASAIDKLESDLAGLKKCIEERDTTIRKQERELVLEDADIAWNEAAKIGNATLDPEGKKYWRGYQAGIDVIRKPLRGKEPRVKK